MNLDGYHAILKLINLSCDVREVDYSGKFNFSYDLVNAATNSLKLHFRNIDSSCVTESYTFELNSFDDVVNKENELVYKKKLQAINVEFKKISAQHDCSFIVHGSLGDGCYIKGWSDVDVICFVPDMVFQKQQLLLDFRKSCAHLWGLMQNICTFQHHGILFLPTSFSQRFDSSLMPIQAIRKGSLIQRSVEKEFGMRLIANSDSLLSLKSLSSRLKTGKDAIKTRIYKHHGKGGIYLNIDFMNASDNMYQLFALISYLMLVPSLVREAIGLPCYKADSFNDLEKYFSDANVSLINDMSSIRNDWGIHHLNNKSNEIPIWIIDRVGDNFIERSNSLLEEAIEVCQKNQ